MHDRFQSNRLAIFTFPHWLNILTVFIKIELKPWYMENKNKSKRRNSGRRSGPIFFPVYGYYLVRWIPNSFPNNFLWYQPVPTLLAKKENWTCFLKIAVIKWIYFYKWMHSVRKCLLWFIRKKTFTNYKNNLPSKGQFLYCKKFQPVKFLKDPKEKQSHWFSLYTIWHASKVDGL